MHSSMGTTDEGGVRDCQERHRGQAASGRDPREASMGNRSSAVDVATAPPTQRLGPKLALQQQQASARIHPVGTTRVVVRV
jgi:hypothetical protein